MPQRIIRTLDDIAKLAKMLATIKLPITLSWVAGVNRTKQQNNLSWMWAGEVAAQKGDDTAAAIRADWKLRYGVPILRSQDVEFQAFYDAAIKPFDLETKLKIMENELCPVTSIMTVPQMVSFLDTVERECIQNGFQLTQPDPELRAYQAKHRKE